MSRKQRIELYRKNTSKYTRICDILYKLDIILIPLLFIGLFKGSPVIELMSFTVLPILAIVELVLVILDAHSRIKKGKEKLKYT